MNRRCNKCGLMSDISNFYVRDRGTKNTIDKTCKSCRRAESLAWRAANQERYEHNWKAYVANNKDKIREKREGRREFYVRRQKASRLNLKLQVLSRYGGRCVCCGETNMHFLSIDHINGNGKAHRKEINHLGTFYHWLRKNGFPQGNYQALCFNCNLGKGTGARCPHEDERDFPNHIEMVREACNL